MLTVTVDHPDFPDGYEFGITGLGIFKNGESREVTEEEERAFVAFYQTDTATKLKQSDYLTVSGDATVTNLEDVLGKDISSTPSPDPTAMNLDPETGKVFAEANIAGKSSDPETQELTTAEADAVAAERTIELPSDTTLPGGDN